MPSQTTTKLLHKVAIVPKWECLTSYPNSFQCFGSSPLHCRSLAVVCIITPRMYPLSRYLLLLLLLCKWFSFSFAKEMTKTSLFFRLNSMKRACTPLCAAKIWYLYTWWNFRVALLCYIILKWGQVHLYGMHADFYFLLDTALHAEN